MRTSIPRSGSRVTENGCGLVPEWCRGTRAGDRTPFSIAQPSDGADHVAAEDTIVALSEGQTRQVRQLAVGHHDGPPQPDRAQTLIELPLGPGNLHRGGFHLERVIEHLAAPGLPDQQQHLLLALAQQRLGRAAAKPRDDELTDGLHPELIVHSHAYLMTAIALLQVHALDLCG